jgi:hypothetical protein
MNNAFTPAAVVAVSLLAAGLGTAAFAASGIPGLAPLESWSSCTDMLCIDAPPQGPKGLDGSGGWGWDSKANAPVAFLIVGKTATFTVTMLQNANTTPLCGVGPGTGSIVLTYSSQDFVLSATSSGGSVAYGQDPGMNPPVFDRGGVAIFPYSGDFFCHGDQSDSFTFTPQNATNTALVTATIIVDGSGQQASGTFPVAILPAPRGRL